MIAGAIIVSLIRGKASAKKEEKTSAI